MDQLADFFSEINQIEASLPQTKEDYLKTLRAILYGKAVEDSINGVIVIGNTTPVPSKKRAKRLSSLNEDEDEAVSTSINKSNDALFDNNGEADTSKTRILTRIKTCNSPAIVEATSTTSNEEDIANALGVTETPLTVSQSLVDLMPPPAAPVIATASDQSFARPQRAAKLQGGKNLKEPALNKKLRRPNNSEIQIKLEHEQRASQMHENSNGKKKSTLNSSKSKNSVASTASQDSLIVLPNKAPSIVSVASDCSDTLTVDKRLENSQSSEAGSNNGLVTRQLSVRIKREKLSFMDGAVDSSSKGTQDKEATTCIESSTTVFSVTTSTTALSNTSTNTTQNKKTGRNKKPVPKPIKVERFSEVDGDKSSPPIASRTRNGNNSFERSKDKSLENNLKETEQQKIQEAENASVYEEALENQPTTAVQSTKENIAQPTNTKVNAINETITITTKDGSTGGTNTISNNTSNNATMVLGTAPNDATFCTAATATFVVDPQNPHTNGSGGAAAVACSDLTFDVASDKGGTESQRSSAQSMATARDTLQPRSDSLITEDDSEPEKTPVAKAVPATKKAPNAPNAPSAFKMNTLPMSASKKLPFPTKSYKMPVREIFNPLVQSPVKKKVEAFESVAAANKKTTRSRLAKENSMSMSTSHTTPQIGRLNSAATGRFLTPTQSGNLISNAKKIPASASKATGLTKSISAGNLQRSASAKAPSRENSAEDVRRGMQLANEERKKQREQKHLQAAQQREAKERERAERMAKAAKEREEKALKKKQLAEQKQRELQEIQRKLKQQEEAAAAAAAAEAAAQKERLMKLNQQHQQNLGSNSAKTRMLPPQPKSKYNFEMLHEDDSTDEETKVTYKRPPPPTWSLSHVRGPAILTQQHVFTECVDSFFSVKPMTIDLKKIFPTIDPRYLKRNSSVIWHTPPRYSELPKY